MKIYRISALVLAAAMVSTFSACHHGTVSSDSYVFDEFNDTPVDRDSIGLNNTTVNVGEPAEANDTVFTLKSVVNVVSPDYDNTSYYYFDVDIENKSDTPYDISMINNFYIIDPSGNNISSSVLTQTFGRFYFTDAAFSIDPISIPASGTFSGLVGGFSVDSSLTDFTLCFYPTKENPNNKKDIISVNVTAADIKAPDNSIIRSDEDKVSRTEMNTGFGQASTLNNTTFTLNNVYTAEPEEAPGSQYVYLDVSVENKTDTAYEISAENNFKITLGSGTEIRSDAAAQSYGETLFTDGSFAADPIAITPNGEFRGVIGGFVLDRSVGSFKASFYPSLANVQDDSNIINVNVTMENISTISQ